MKLYNTFSRKKEKFVPQKDNIVTMYSCGPTVYSYAHIGNLRTYIFMDLLRRTLKYSGYELNGIMNITDVGHLLSDADEGEDKMEKAAREQQKSPYEIAKYYTDVFMGDLEKLNIQVPEIVPKATEHIDEMLEFVYALYDNGYAYKTSDGIYFDISKFSDYGKLSGIDLEKQRAGARVDVNDEKKNPHDFALWKNAPKEHIMQWDSRWGKGYPGWHIECSAMGRKYLGDTFDIHTGGVDHIPIHHENEIAQSCAVTGKIPAKYWLHSEFMLVDGGKMSKKLKNTYTITQLEQKGYKAMDFRYFCLNAHYRKKLNFTFEGMDGAKTSYQRLCGLIQRHKESQENTQKQTLDKYLAEFEREIFDDLNIPGALGVLWTMLKEPYSKDIYNLALQMDKVFGLSLDNIQNTSQEDTSQIPAEIINLAQERDKARRQKDFALSDKLRAQIESLGYTLKDTKDGYVIQKA